MAPPRAICSRMGIRHPEPWLRLNAAARRRLSSGATAPQTRSAPGGRAAARPADAARRTRRFAARPVSRARSRRRASSSNRRSSIGPNAASRMRRAGGRRGFAPRAAAQLAAALDDGDEAAALEPELAGQPESRIDLEGAGGEALNRAAGRPGATAESKREFHEVAVLPSPRIASPFRCLCSGHTTS